MVIFFKENYVAVILYILIFCAAIGAATTIKTLYINYELYKYTKPAGQTPLSIPKGVSPTGIYLPNNIVSDTSSFEVEGEQQKPFRWYPHTSPMSNPMILNLLNSQQKEEQKIEKLTQKYFPNS
jgi:hypothetical protein